MKYSLFGILRNASILLLHSASPAPQIAIFLLYDIFWLPFARSSRTATEESKMRKKRSIKLLLVLRLLDKRSTSSSSLKKNSNKNV